MQKTTQAKARCKKTDFEFRLLWSTSFLLVLFTTTFKRLLPTQWRHWRQGKNLFSVIGEARETADIVTPMAYKAY